MADQPRYDPMEESKFFPDGQSARPLLPGTVARGHLRDDDAFFDPPAHGARWWNREPDVFPMEMTLDVLKRGRERFNIYCAVCHDRLGTGNGRIVQRGYVQPPSYHGQRLRDAPVGHFFRVITNGHGAMPTLADQVPPRDRWAIVGYIRALQQSQSRALDDVPAVERGRLVEILKHLEAGEKALADGVKLAADGKKEDAGKKFDEAIKEAEAALALDDQNREARKLKADAEAAKMKEKAP
jgi:mono/diheme cytochrome c family protein